MADRPCVCGCGRERAVGAPLFCRTCSRAYGRHRRTSDGTHAADLWWMSRRVQRFARPAKIFGKHRCDSCGLLTRDETAACDHCGLDDK